MRARIDVHEEHLNTRKLKRSKIDKENRGFVARERMRERGARAWLEQRGRGRKKERKVRQRDSRSAESAVSVGVRRLKLCWRGSAAFANVAASLTEKSSSRLTRYRDTFVSLLLFLLFFSLFFFFSFHAPSFRLQFW